VRRQKWAVLLWPDDTHESRKYEGVLREYELMGVKTQSSLALLNFGQSFIFTSSLTLMMILAANGIRAGRLRLTPAQCVSGAIYTSSTARPAPAVQAPWGSESTQRWYWEYLSLIRHTALLDQPLALLPGPPMSSSLVRTFRRDRTVSR
jgi:hypothetical protein